MKKQFLKSAVSSILLLTLIGCGRTPATSTQGGTTMNTNDPALSENDKLYAEFKNPDEHLKTKPLFFWNVPLSEMTTDGIREIVRRSYQESGYNGFGILPYWLDGYLSEEYFDLYEAALDEGSKYGMQFSLYDEDGFPSYTAGGLFAEKYPSLTAHRLDKYEVEAKAGDKVFLRLPQGVLLSAVAMNTATKERIDISKYASIVKLPDFDPESQPIGPIASSVYTVEDGYEADKAFDGNPNTRWNALSYSGNREWIGINYGKEVTFDSVKVYEDKNPVVQRVRAFDVQYWNGSEWKTVASGSTVTDKGVELKFEPVKAQFVRLYCRKISGDSSSITELEIYSNGKRLDTPKPEQSDSAKPGYSCSSIYDGNYNAEKAFDGNPETRWNSARGASVNEWLMASFGRTVEINRAVISEALDRISSFTIEYFDGQGWKVAASGSTIGINKIVDFAPVATDRMRLVVSTPNGELPSIYELAFFNGDEKIIPVNQADENYRGSSIEFTVPADWEVTWKIMGFLSVLEGSEGMDYLDSDAVAGYIEITHEAYYKRFKKYFDNGTITTSFYDEPSFYPANENYGVEGSRMWTDSFNEFYKSRFDGEDPALLYPALWYDIGEDTTAARDRLLGTRSEMFAKNYIGQIDSWCTSHGISLMGHMLMEEQINPLPLEGDLMLSFKYQTIPGVDLITYYGFSQEAYKIISSSAQNWDKTLVMCEAFGAMGEGISPDILYKGTIDLLAKGINLIVPHAVWYDNTKNVVFPPELSYRNPNYSKMLSDYNTYEARIASLLQRQGSHVADIALLYPIDSLESDYTFDVQMTQPGYANYMKIGEYLSLTARRDFTYLHPQILDGCTVENGMLTMTNKINTERFKVVIIPGMTRISLSNLEKIYSFWQAGGSVISVGKLPTAGIERSEDARVKEILTEMFGADPASVTGNIENIGEWGKAFHVSAATGLGSVLDKATESPDVAIKPSKAQLSGGNLSYIHKVVDGRNLYFIGNSSDTKIDLEITLRGKFEVLELWDPATGERTLVETSVNGDSTALNLTMDKVSSYILIESAS